MLYQRKRIAYDLAHDDRRQLHITLASDSDLSLRRGRYGPACVAVTGCMDKDVPSLEVLTYVTSSVEDR